jgi:hypothetical protein
MSRTMIEVCHVVENINVALKHWIEVLGVGPFFLGDITITDSHRYRGRIATLSMRLAFGLSGGTIIELVEPLEGDESAFSEGLRENGPGHHHFMFAGDYDEDFANLTAHGFEPALESVTVLGERCALFDTRSANNGYIEVADLQISFSKMTRILQAANAEPWDTPRIRPLTELYGGADPAPL